MSDSTVDAKIAKAMRESEASSAPSTLSLPPYLNPNFQKALRMSGDGAKKILTICLSSPEPPPDAAIKEAESLANFEIPIERLIGCTGNSGSGKSSLICSLLQTEGIAIVDGSGKAVTCFPVYYKYRLPVQTARYVVHCVFPIDSKVDKLLESYLEDLNALNQSEEEELSTAELEVCEEKARAAGDTFKALFGNMTSFALKKLRIGRGKVTKDSAIALLHEWRKQLSWPEGMRNDGVWSAEAGTTKELQEIQARFRNSGLWPLIDKLSIYLEAPLLRSGVVLVDLPGFHDSNFARVRIARETQAKCDDLFVVANINRAVDNPNLQKIVKENMPRPEVGDLTLQTVTVLATHSGVFEKDIEKLANSNILKAAKAKILELKRKGASWDAIEDAQNQADDIVIKARNRKVMKNMKTRYGSKLTHGQFHVFCVDNAMFMQKESDRKEISGIPRLQAHVQELPGMALFRVHDAYINTYLAAHYSFATYVAGGRPRPDAFNHVLPEPEALRNIHQTLKGWSDAMVSEFSRCIITAIQNDKDNISKAALKVANGWRNIHTSTVRAICKKHGRHNTRVSGNYDWNEDLIDCFRAETEENWFRFDNIVRQGLATLFGLIFAAFTEYPDICIKLGAPLSLIKSLKLRQQSVDDAAKFARDGFLRELGTLKRNMIISHDASYVLDSMISAYERAAEVRGKGASVRRHAILEDCVRSPEFVDNITGKLSEAFEELIERHSSAVLEKLEAATRGIEATVDNFQGKRHEIPLFLRHPEFARKAEACLKELENLKQQIESLAEPSRQRAAELYGKDNLTPNVTAEAGTSTKHSSKEEEEALENPPKRIKREHSDEEDESHADDCDSDSDGDEDDSDDDESDDEYEEAQ